MMHKIDSSSYYLADHLGGFSADFNNNIIDSLPLGPLNVSTEYVLPIEIKKRYPQIKFSLAYNAKKKILNGLSDYLQHPAIEYKNFLCSFNGSEHVGRKLLVAIINQFGYFNTNYCSKNFVFSVDKLDGHISDYVADQDVLYRKFFISTNSSAFFNTVNSFGHDRYNHKQNIYNLEHKLTQSFLHLVSETMATSYVPFVTEKFLYSVVTRGLFLSYAQPGWHAHVEKHFGFKRYTKLFDYEFDSVQNPVERLVKLMAMVSKFNLLTPDDWKDLYQIEQETIEYNYHHYFSQDYLKCLAK